MPTPSHTTAAVFVLPTGSHSVIGQQVAGLTKFAADRLGTDASDLVELTMRSPIIVIASSSLLLLSACDEAVDKSKDEDATASQASMHAAGHVDLQAIVQLVEEGEVESAEDLEAAINGDAEGVAHVDVDADGKADELRIVETREEKQTTFEIHAIPSSGTAVGAKVEGEASAKAEGEASVDAQPTVARLTMSADADAQTVTASASISASFTAKLAASANATVDANAKLEAEAAVTKVLTGITTDAEGRMVVEASATPFVAWTFKAERPTYVAKALVVQDEKKRPEADPCWPPGHCKHGLWKARGERPPGQEKLARVDGSDKSGTDGKGKGQRDEGKAEGKGEKGKSSKGKSESKSSKGKSGSKSSEGKSGSKSSKGKSESKSSKSKGKDSGKDGGKSKGKKG